MEPKKIGIISYWDSKSNYGQILQGVALQYALKSLGFYPITMKYIISSTPEHKSIYQHVKRIFHDDISLLDHIKRRIASIFQRKGKKETLNFDQRQFDIFKQQYLNLSKTEYTSLDELVSESTNDANQFYAFISGSDQVWHESGNNEKKRVFLLDFVPPTIKRLSYAASFGRDKITDAEEINLFKSCLSKFNAVSVREETGVTICKMLHRNDAIKVVDPTLLLDQMQWKSFLSLKEETKSNNKKAFIYSLEANNPIIHKLITYFEKNNYIINYVCSASVPDNKTNCEATIEEWLELIDSANIVITNSFHGTIFSLNFNTPVISIGKVYSLQEKQNQRIYSIMKELNLLDFFINQPYCDSKIEELLSKSINWDAVNSYFKKEKIKGISFLKQNL